MATSLKTVEYWFPMIQEAVNNVSTNFSQIVVDLPETSKVFKSVILDVLAGSTSFGNYKAYSYIGLSIDASITSDYNLFYQENAGGRLVDWRDNRYYASTWNTYKSTWHMDNHSPPPVNPLLTNAPYNFMPLIGSPLISAGIYIAEVSTDFNSVIRSNPPSIGAYEYLTSSRRLYKINNKILLSNNSLISVDIS